MSDKTTYLATFEDGDERRRTTSTKAYTHAWRAKTVCPWNKGRVLVTYGFSRSVHHAFKAARQSGGKDSTIDVAVAVPVFA